MIHSQYESNIQIHKYRIWVNDTQKGVRKDTRTSSMEMRMSRIIHEYIEGKKRTKRVMDIEYIHTKLENRSQRLKSALRPTYKSIYRNIKVENIIPEYHKETGLIEKNDDISTKWVNV